MIKYIRNNECARRAVRTFFQAAAGSLVVSLSSGTSVTTALIQSAILSAIAAGIAALMNLNEEEK